MKASSSGSVCRGQAGSAPSQALLDAVHAQPGHAPAAVHLLYARAVYAAQTDITAATLCA